MKNGNLNLETKYVLVVDSNVVASVLSIRELRQTRRRQKRERHLKM